MAKHEIEIRPNVTIKKPNREQIIDWEFYNEEVREFDLTSMTASEICQMLNEYLDDNAGVTEGTILSKNELPYTISRLKAQDNPDTEKEGE